MVDTYLEHTDSLPITEVHDIMREMLQEVSRFTENNNLKVILLGGTLLGSVRQGCFLPWDDDLDVGLNREEYELFQTTFTPNNKRFELVRENDPTNNMPYLRLVDTKTVGESEYYKQTHGIFLDIFPIDTFNWRGLKKINFMIGHKILNVLRNNARSTGVYPPKAKIVLLKQLIHKGIVNRSAHFYAKKQVKQVLRFLRKSDLKTNSGVLNGMYGHKEVMPKDMFQQLKKVSFEGAAVWRPMRFREYLTKMYGDWEIPKPGVGKHAKFYYRENN